MSKQLCYKCVHNTTGGVIAEDFLGNEVCGFDCKLKEGVIMEDFTKDCADFKDESAEVSNSYKDLPEPTMEIPPMEEVADIGVTAINNVFMLYDLTLKVGVKIVNEELLKLKEKYENYEEE